ncbi:recombinase family protein [Streptomyces sp. NPDC051907]|uniref:recombinase family protein n=1 Tax=Streptomyces sp. NPDC051907 TaxID=3155284 RepID=UPI0034131D47
MWSPRSTATAAASRTSSTWAAELRTREIGFSSLHENLDTITSGGRLVFHVVAALAEFVRELIVLGAREGLAAARARGQVGGRPTVATEEVIEAARDLLPDPRPFHRLDRQAPRRLPGRPLQPHPRPARTRHGAVPCQLEAPAQEAYPSKLSVRLPCGGAPRGGRVRRSCAFRPSP